VTALDDERLAEMRAVHDRLYAALDALRVACEDLTQASRSFRQAVERGEALASLYHERSLGSRDAFYRAVEAAEGALNDSRAWSVRTLHDVEGLSFNSIAALHRRSRQFIARLYRRPPPAEAVGGVDAASVPRSPPPG
jgi:superfamily I DNA/RNA helicase